MTATQTSTPTAGTRPRPVDPDGVVAAVEALAASDHAGAVVVVDLDRLHLLTPGRPDAPAALDRALDAVERTLRGRSPWLRLADDVLVVLGVGVASEADAAELTRLVLDAATGPDGADGIGVPWTPATGTAWAARPTADLLDRALAACWRARHGATGPAVAPVAPAPVASVPVRATPVAPAPAAGPAATVTAPAATAPRPRPVPVPVPDAPPAAAPRSAFDDFLVAISGRALGLDPAAFVASLDDVLGELLRVADADYAFVDVLDPDGRTVHNLAGAAAPGHDGFVRQEPRLLEPDDPWRRMLAELEPVAVDDQFASHDGAHPANHPLGCAARAFLTVPFVVGGAMAGALGVGCVERAHAWSPAEVAGVRLATGLVAAVLERDRLRRAQAD